jgi:hypothetical protein
MPGSPETQLITNARGDARDNIYVTLTVIDAAGAGNSVTEPLSFAQPYSGYPRTNCPRVRARSARFAAHSIKLTAKRTSVSARIRCASVADCAGTLKLLTHSSRSHRRAKAVVIASSRFFSIPGHRAATITAKLTRAGRALLRRGKPVGAIAQLTTVGITGRAITQSLTATVIGKRKRG